MATGYGQPPSTFYDWTLAPSGAHEPDFKLTDNANGRLLIEEFSNKVTKALYSNRLDPVGLVSDRERSVHTTFLAREYEDLEQKLQLDGFCKCVSCNSIVALCGLSFRNLQFASTLTLISKYHSLCSLSPRRQSSSSSLSLL